MPFPANTPTVDDLPGLGLQDIAQLPVELLAILQRETDEALRRAKAAKARHHQVEVVAQRLAAERFDVVEVKQGSPDLSRPA